MTTTTTLYTLEEVSKNNGKDNTEVWVVIKDTVYNFTTYLDEHPGGGELILEFAGKDGTKGFNDFGHSIDAKDQMKKYKIGELVEADKAMNRQKTKTSSDEKPEQRSCFSIITCGIFS